MDIAYHFNADIIESQYSNEFYNMFVLEKLFHTLLVTHFNNLNLKIFEGDLVVHQYVNGENVTSLIDEMLGVGFRTWKEIDIEKIRTIVRDSNIYVVMIEGLSDHMRDHIAHNFSSEKSYLGAFQITAASEVQWSLYKQSLSPHYRYVDRSLRIFYTMGEEDGRDNDLVEKWKRLSFQTVEWENLNARHTIFDAYQNYDHSVLLVQLNEILSSRLSQLAEDILLRLGDLNPKLPSILYAAFKTFYSVQTAEEISQVALSCRRFIEGLADTLYAPRNEKVNGRNVNAAAYRNRLWAYIQERFDASEQSKDLAQIGIQDLGSRIDKIDALANKGVHADIILLDLDRLLISLITVTYDLLTLAPPPIEVPIEPHLPEIYKFIETLAEDNER